MEFETWKKLEEKKKRKAEETLKLDIVFEVSPPHSTPSPPPKKNELSGTRQN